MKKREVKINVFSKKVVISFILIVMVLTFVSCTSSDKTEEMNLKRSQDTEFASDSGVRIEKLSEVQQKNLHTLAKVWGFAKYRHPEITAGNINWDAELFRVMPKVLEATTKEEAGDIMATWLNQFPFQVNTLSKEQEDLYRQVKEKAYLDVEYSWIKNRQVLGNNLADYLENLSKVKVTDNDNGYAVFEEGDIVNVSSDSFMDNSINYEDTGMRLLGLFRYWNIIEYFYPYKNLMDEDWDQVLYDKIPELALQSDKESYVLSIANLTTYIHDSHGGFNDNFKVLPQHFGAYKAEASIFNIDGQIVIAGREDKSPLKVGDIVVAIDGTSIEKIIEECNKYISVSDKNRFTNAFDYYLLRSTKEIAEIEVIRNGEKLSLNVPCYYNGDYDVKKLGQDEKSGFMVDKKIGYLNISTLESGDLDKLMKKFKGTEGLIIDVRYDNAKMSEYIKFINYPIGEYIKPEVSEYQQFYSSNSFEPGKFIKSTSNSSGRGFIAEQLDKGIDSTTFSKIFDNGIIRTSLGKVKDRYQYNGKVIILMNECTQSVLETMVMSFMDAPNATVIGTPSAGANGNIMDITLPGCIQTSISGLAVTYMDGSQTQRIGLKPDITVKQTVKGIAEGKDEVIEKAIELITKPESK
ncbi:S41 family peptidase [Clostridium sp. UBA3061]|uniref:S41 family peptidase n=1 Tax=Clostridium sp. UBA3061 TaxID=1946353 RepID=UPI0032164C03